MYARAVSSEITSQFTAVTFLIPSEDNGDCTGVDKKAQKAYSETLSRRNLRRL